MEQVANILIVDDDTIVAKSVEAVLKRMEYDITVLSDAIEAVDLLHKSLFDLAILDVMMPVMTGFQIMESVKDLELDTLFIIMTGDTSIESAIKAVRKGACDYIRKPFEPDELLIRVENALRQKKYRDEKKLIQSEKKQLEFQLRQSQKMEAIGTLAGGMAHDFNNTLGIIIGNTELAIKSLDFENPAGEYLNNILTASSRAEKMVSRLLSFSRVTDAEKKPVNFIANIDESLALLRSSLPSDIEIRRDFPEDPIAVMGDSTQINQVMINLCTNSSHAMSKSGGILSIGISSVEIGPESGHDLIDLPPGPYAELTVADTGCGIPEVILDRVFDPYFTTKEPGKGTGMGLAVVHGIIKNHGGSISVKSDPGNGTVFTIYLPETDAAIDIKPDVCQKSLPGGKEHILLVDDENMIVDTMKIMMEQLGYRVDAFTDSNGALEAFRKCPDTFDMVVTDMTMPKMTGDLLAVKIQEIKKGTPVIVCTGLNNKIGKDEAKRKGIMAILNKPVRTTKLAQAINDILHKNNEERRIEKRFEVKDKTFVISPSNPKKKYSMLDISKSGMSFKYLSVNDQVIENCRYNIITSDERFYMENIRCRTISDVLLNETSGFVDISMRRRGIQFENLTNRQSETLGYFLQNYTGAYIN